MNLELLNSVFRRNGYLGDASVIAIEVAPFETNGIGSSFESALLRCSGDDHRLPQRLLIKRPNLGDRGQSEADYYELMRGAAGSAELPLMQCFGVVDEGPEQPLALFFEDLATSHHQTTWPIVPPLADCEKAVATLARVHAFWWGRAESIHAPTPAVVAHQDANHLAAFLSDFVDRVGEYLSAERIIHYEQLFANLDALLAARLSVGNTTLVHTDPHFWNYLYPDDGRKAECVIFDWPLWRTGLAGWDLAYMIAAHLYPEHRRRFESALLDRYCRVLNANGVRYDRQDVQLDYRVGVLMGLLMPVMEFSWNIPPLDWMPKLEKLFATFDDLNCRELLDSA